MSSVPSPPTFRAPTRESLLLQKRRLSPPPSYAMEEDLSFMDAEIERLHRDMANMLAAAGPLTYTHAGNRPGRSRLPAMHSSPSDSDDDCVDDDPALSALRDDLRSTTEKFFERNRPSRRASMMLQQSSGARDGASTRFRPQSFRQEKQVQSQTWYGLSDLEKGMGGLMRRQAGTASSPSMFPPVEESSVGPTAERSQATTEGQYDSRAREGQPQTSSGASVGHDSSGRSQTGMSSWGDELSLGRSERLRSTPNTERDFPPSPRRRATLAGGEDLSVLPRRRNRDAKTKLQDLRARSDEAKRTVDALKVFLLADGFRGGDIAQGSHERVGEQIQSTCEGARPSEEAAHRMPQLLRAMENLQQVNEDLQAALSKVEPTTQGDASGSRLEDGNAESPSSSRKRILTRRRTLRGDRSRSRGRQSQSSSDLLARRRSKEGQAEPMSCGVPRYRIQVTEAGADAVYFELAITQARSMWTVERREDEFAELRRSLVDTATELASASSRQRGEQDSRKRHRRQGEARVPQLHLDKGRWFERTPIGLVLTGRSREEKLAEKQVLLASWLAHVLADSALMSPELVRFLGGDNAAQPLVGEGEIGSAAIADSDSTRLWDSSDSSDSNDLAPAGEWPDVTSRTYSSDDRGGDDDNDEVVLLRSEPESSHASLASPSDWAPTASSPAGHAHADRDDGKVSQRERLEQAMGRRAAAARRLSPKNVEPAHEFVVDDTPAREISLEAAGRLVLRRAGVSSPVDKEEDEYEVEDDDEEEEEEEEEDHSPILLEPWYPSTLAPGSRHFSEGSQWRRTQGPSPSSPRRRLTLDAFFQAPT